MYCSTISYSFSQERKTNSVYFEFAGVAGNYSINYERIVGSITNWLYYSAGGGFSVWNNTVVNFPLHIKIIAGKKAHNLEAGIGAMPEFYFNKNGNDQSIMIYYDIGYRFQKPNGKIRLNFTVSPMYEPSIRWQTIAVGIGAGYVF